MPTESWLSLESETDDNVVEKQYIDTPNHENPNDSVIIVDNNNKKPKNVEKENASSNTANNIEIMNLIGQQAAQIKAMSDSLKALTIEKEAKKINEDILERSKSTQVRPSDISKEIKKNTEKPSQTEKLIEEFAKMSKSLMISVQENSKVINNLATKLESASVPHGNPRDNRSNTPNQTARRNASRRGRPNFTNTPPAQRQQSRY